ncbi:MAG: hypothetical protein QXZ43_00235 [Candidatus Aenigmatarchaeota archaeon]
MGLKGQVFLLSSAIIIVVLTIIELNFLDLYRSNRINIYRYNYETDYIYTIEKEIFLSSSISNQSCLENFIDFLNFEKNFLYSKNYNINTFVAFVSYYKNIDNKINLTLINYMNKDFNVEIYINSTPQQSDSIFLKNNKNYSKLFDIDPQKDYILTIKYLEEFNMTLSFKENHAIFIFIDINVSSENINYIDKSQKIYYFT